MTTQFPPSDFDYWAATYDRSTVGDTGFPFDGYYRVLQIVVDLAGVAPGADLLDLGTGTGNLALLFTRKGCGIWGIDFSSEMLALAKLKLPGAELACLDIRSEWPEAFQRRYNFIVSAYTFHHFPLEEKVALVRRLLEKYLHPGGNLVIGDIAFQDTAAEDLLRCLLGEEWEQEYYWLADESLAAFTAAGIPATYTQVSSCAGVFHFHG